MNGRRMGMVIVLAGLAVSRLGAEPARVEVLSERVNLRAKPRPEAEVAGQVGRGVILEYRGTNMEWVAVAPPTNVGLWISSEYVKDNKVGTGKLNVRAGAGINYPVVGTVYLGDVVTPRSQMGQWMEIAPPTNAVLWVHQDYVRAVAGEAALSNAAPADLSGPVPAAAAPADAPVVRPAPAVPAVAAAIPEPEPPVIPPPDLKEKEIVPLPGQGETMQFEGALHKTSFLDFSRIGDYCLVAWERGRPVTVCYIKGDKPQLKSLEGRRLRIKGDGYWLKESAKPLLIPREITPLVDAPAAPGADGAPAVP